MNIPTPIIQLKNDLNGNSLYCKRDDLIPFSFGGNKARKAKLFFEDIISRGCDVVVTYGSSASNHCRVVANMAASCGLDCVIISPEENYKETTNSKLIEVFDTKIVKTPLNSVSKTIDKIMLELSKKHNPYFIQGGGHGRIGTAAYVNAYDEICLFEEENNIKFDYIFLASGTGTTQAGLVAGRLIKKNDKQKIIGISIARPNPRGKDVVLNALNEYFNDSKDYSGEVDFIDDFLCGGYGKYNNDILNIIKNVFINDGMPLNTTYTGKAFYGMESYIKSNNLSGKNILFINTGGSPLFFDDLEEIKK